MRFLILLLLLISVPAFADDSPCEISMTNWPVHEGALRAPLTNGDDRFVMWFCNGDTSVVYFNTYDSAKFWPYIKKIGGPSASDIATMQVLVATGTPSNDDEAKAAQHIAMVDFYGYKPKATEGIVYRRRIVINGPPQWVPYGKADVGTECDNPDKLPAGNMMRVDRALATRNSILTTTPDTAWMWCA